MKNLAKSTLLAAAFVSLTAVAIVGCGGGGGSTSPSVPTVGSGGAITQLQAKLDAGGVIAAWPNAYISGTAPLPSCDPVTDTNCLAQFSNQESNSDGLLNLQSDAIPGEWFFAADEDSNCSSGASTGAVQASAEVPVEITCGEDGAGSALVSPSECVETFNSSGEIIDNTCPATVSVSVNDATLPVSHDLSVSVYDTSATLITSSSIKASSSTSLTMPTPRVDGTAVITIVDPSTNQVLGAGLFSRYVITVGGRIPPPTNG